MTMQEKARQAARSMKTYEGLDQVADVVAKKMLREVLALDYHSAEGMRMQVERWLAEFSPSPRPEPAAPPRDVDPETALGDCPACGLPMPHGPAGCPRTLRQWLAEPAAPETPEPPRLDEIEQCDGDCGSPFCSALARPASESRPTSPRATPEGQISPFEGVVEPTLVPPVQAPEGRTLKEASHGPDDAALLAEAEKRCWTFNGHGTPCAQRYTEEHWCLVCRLSAALRAALQREQERRQQCQDMAEAEMNARMDRDGWRLRAEAAERDLASLRVGKEEKTDTRLAPPERVISPDQRIDDRER